MVNYANNYRVCLIFIFINAKSIKFNLEEKVCIIYNGVTNDTHTQTT
jgi:hypothetical protein